MKLSFVITTLGHPALAETVNSIISAYQHDPAGFDLEVWLVFQGNALVKGDWLAHVRSLAMEKKGLSAARNVALARAEGDLFIMMDDDAAIAADYFIVLRQMLAKNPGYAAYCGNIRTKNGQYFIQDFADVLSHALTYKEYRLFLGSAHILTRKAIDICGVYDERFGAGAKYGSGEETDYFIRLIKNKLKVYYCDKLTYFHPIAKYDLAKVYRYATGQGALCAKYGLVQLFKPGYWLALYVRFNLLCVVKILVSIPLMRLKRINSLPAVLGFNLGFITFVREAKKAVAR